MAMTLYATNIYSNDGSTLLWNGAIENSVQIAVTSTGATFTCSDKFTGVWRYGGSGTFLGLATSANAGSATYVVGSSFYTSMSTLNLYIVTSGGSSGTDTGDATATAADILYGKTAYIASGKVTGTYSPPQSSTPHLTVSYNGRSIVSTDVTSQTVKTMNCSGKVMSSNIQITVTP